MRVLKRPYSAVRVLKRPSLVSETRECRVVDVIERALVKGVPV